MDHENYIVVVNLFFIIALTVKKKSPFLGRRSFLKNQAQETKKSKLHYHHLHVLVNSMIHKI